MLIYHCILLWLWISKSLSVSTWKLIDCVLWIGLMFFVLIDIIIWLNKFPVEWLFSFSNFVFILPFTYDRNNSKNRICFKANHYETRLCSHINDRPSDSSPNQTYNLIIIAHPSETHYVTLCYSQPLFWLYSQHRSICHQAKSTQLWYPTTHGCRNYCLTCSWA